MTRPMDQRESSLPLYISIIEDNRFFRTGWEEILKQEKDFSLVGSYSTCEEALSSPAIGESDVCMMDIGLPGMSGIEGVRQIKQRYPSIAIVMCTVHDDDESIFESLCAGAVGFLMKKTDPEDLVAALKDAAGGGSPMSPNVARRVILSFQKPPSRPLVDEDRLTERELHILQQMATGKSYSTIADEISLSVAGVRYHIRHIYEKLQVHTRAEAIAQGLKERIIRPPR
jgi:DNA-binding NarL/FixJ family response regulator